MLTQKDKTDLLHKVYMFLRRPFKCHDEPYMAFYAEYQYGPGYGSIWLAYYEEINGDICHDPLVIFHIDKRHHATSIKVQNDLARSSIVAGPEDEYPWEFLRLTWERHMKDRVKPCLDLDLDAVAAVNRGSRYDEDADESPEDGRPGGLDDDIAANEANRQDAVEDMRAAVTALDEKDLTADPRDEPQLFEPETNKDDVD